MSDGPLHFTKRELQSMLASPLFWTAMIGASLLLGIVGPFGTYAEMRLPGRLAYWAAVAVSTYLVGAGTTHLLSRLIPLPALPPAVAYAIYGAIAGVPATLVVWGLNRTVFPATGGIPLAPLLAATMAIGAVVATVVAAFSARLSALPAANASPAAPDTSRRPAILDRLPPHLRGELSHMTVQDHYVDVRTDKGGTLVLIRLSDAIAETAGVEGLQVHRSHWVAASRVEESVHVGGRLMLKMRDGTMLPVSRSYLADVRAAGLA